ncbi:MAG: RagB/SusD family nutrient uptake outer membrane protein [Gemmatimonadota bacterium]
MIRHFVATTVAVALLAGCNADALNVPNFNSAATTTTADLPLIQNLASGIFIQSRANLPGLVSDAGIFGRESYNYFQTDGRNTSNYLTVAQLDNAGFAAGGWTGRYTNMRNAINFIQIVDEASFLTAAQKSAAKGFAKTFRAMEVFYTLSQRDSIGMPVDIDMTTNLPQPFVSRDSAYKFGSALMDDAAADLAAGGAAFPFALPSGFAPFSTPATFIRFNRAMAARYLVYRGSLECGAPCYTAALTALNASFINSAPGADLRLGAYNTYSASAGDALNPLSVPVAPDQVAHASIVSDAQFNGTTRDLRVAAKTRTIPSKAPPGNPAPGIATTVGFTLYLTNTTSMPVIRNEELILLRAEANIGLTNLGAALADINYVRTTSGGLLPLAPFTSQADALTALLYEKRYSLLWEGHRWIDLRRYNRLNTLPLDLPTHFRIKVQPVPQAECLFRAPLDAALKGPGCP